MIYCMIFCVVQRQFCGQADTLIGCGLDDKMAAEQVCPLRHAGQPSRPKTGHCFIGTKTAAFIPYLQAKQPTGRPEPNRNSLYVGMPRHIRQRFLNDTVRGGFDLIRKRRSTPVCSNETWIRV